MLSHCPNLVAIGCKEPIIPAGYRFVRPDRKGLKRSYKTLKEKWRGKIQACQQYVVTKNFVNDTTTTIVALRRPKLLVRVTINWMESCQILKNRSPYLLQIWPLLSGHLYWGEVVTVQNSQLAIFTVFHLCWAVSLIKQKRLSSNLNFLPRTGWKRAWEGSGSPPQSQVKLWNSNECSDALVCIVIYSWKSNVMWNEDGEQWLAHFDSVCKWRSE